jgi:hypothetical protein
MRFSSPEAPMGSIELTDTQRQVLELDTESEILTPFADES